MLLGVLLQSVYPYCLFEHDIRVKAVFGQLQSSNKNLTPAVAQETDNPEQHKTLSTESTEPNTTTEMTDQTFPKGESLDLRPAIIADLDVLRRTSSTEPAGVFKARSYEGAIKYLQELPTPIRTLEDLPPYKKGDKLTGKLREKVVERITTGAMEEAEKARLERAPDSIEAFLGIYGVGPKKALDLIAAGHRTIQELRAAAAADPKLFNKNQRIGLQYYDDLQKRIPRTEMDKHAAQLMAVKPASLEGVIVGSYRRGRPDSGDIDMLVRTTDAAVDAGKALADYVKALKAAGYVKEVLAIGSHKCLAIAQLADGAEARRLDLLVTPPAEFPFAVLYFTGSDTFNVRMRQLALEKGYTLNEHALTKVKTSETVTGLKTERDIFDFLKMEWREPEERTGADALVARA
jgi:DNA polymerase/3'-5' exonuclease PolX